MKGYTEKEIKSVMGHLKEAGLIDDRSLALDFRNYALETKRLGVLGIRNFLLNRGIPKDVVEELCHDIDEIDEENNAMKLVEKRIKNQTDGENKKRVYSLLQRKGYSHETIKRVLKKFFDEEVS